MFKSRLLPIITCCLGLALLISSSGWFGESPATDEVSMAEVSSVEKMSPLESPLDITAVQPGNPPPLKSSPLERPLKVGDRFFLRKTAEQRVTQEASQESLASTSQLSVTLILEVANIIGKDDWGGEFANRNAGDTKFNVRYQQVKFVQDLPGQAVDYDSDRHSGPVPPPVAAYHGLLGRGFSFWLDRDNRLLELAGFQEFIQSCLQHVPPQQRTAVWKSFAGISETDHLAGFVDDSIGLLPLQSLETGKTWRRERHVRHPLPVDLVLQYTIEDISPDTAMVVVGGAVAPQEELSAGAVKLRILGGRVSGRYTIDSRTGLPRNSRVEQVLEMIVQLPDGTTFEQTKQTITKITTWPGAVPSGKAVPYAGREKSAVIR